MNRIFRVFLAVALLVASAPAVAQSPPINQYGTGNWSPQCIVNPVSYTVAAGTFWLPACTSGGALNVTVVGSGGSPAPTSSPGGAPLVVPANASAAPYSATNPLPVTTPAPSTTGAPGYTRIQDGTGTLLANVAGWGSQDAVATTFEGLIDGSYNLGYNGSTWDRLRVDPNATGVLRVTTGGSTTATVAAASAGPNVIKASAGRLARVIITTAGTSGTDIFYDNASACSGTIIGEIAGTTALATNVAGGVPFQFDMPAANGITECGGTGSAAVTVSYF